MFRAPDVPAGEVLKNCSPPRIFYCRRGRLVEKVLGFVIVCKPSTLSCRSLLTFMSSGVVFRCSPLFCIQVNKNSPPSVCLLRRSSVFFDFLSTSSPSSPSTSFSPPLLPPLSFSSFLLDQQTDRRVGVLRPIGGLDFDHMPVEDRPKPAALLMQGKP